MHQLCFRHLDRSNIPLKKCSMVNKMIKWLKRIQEMDETQDLCIICNFKVAFFLVVKTIFPFVSATSDLHFYMRFVQCYCLNFWQHIIDFLLLSPCICQFHPTVVTNFETNVVHFVSFLLIRIRDYLLSNIYQK